MLRIVVGEEGFDDDAQKFVLIDPVTLDFEHSLASLSKWESEYEVPFLGPGEKTREEMFGYVRAMLVTPEISPEVLLRLTVYDIAKIQQYINSAQSATTFGRMPERPGRGEIITAELIYYWMVAFNIPFETQYWHLNRLLSLIKICNIKNSKPQKQDRHTAAVERARLNAERRERLGTKG